jgi:hypothetical protein
VKNKRKTNRLQNSLFKFNSYRYDDEDETMFGDPFGGTNMTDVEVGLYKFKSS